MKESVCFYMGYSPSFNGENYEEKKIYGSEITTIKLAESLVDLYNVYIFLNIDLEDEIIYNNVHYLNSDKINNFKEIDVMIIVRYINYFIYFKNIAKKTFIWLHDVTVQPSYDGKILISNGDHILYNLRDCYDKLIVLSNYHLNNNFDYIKVPVNKYRIIPNIQNINYYKSNIPIIKNRFIYMSDISRGFTILLECLIYIQKFIPDISLVVFREHEFTEDIRNKIKYLNNISIYGKVGQEKIANECLQAEYFFYPTNFHETFCNCAAEAQLYNTVCIYNNIGALNTTIGNRGLCITHDLNSLNYIENTCNDVMILMNDENKKKHFRTKGHEWAKTLDINNIKKEWLKLLKND